MELRDRCELAIRRFHALEVGKGFAPVIDYDCAPRSASPAPYPSRLAALDELTDLLSSASNGPVAEQVAAHRTYLAALLGEQRPLADYVLRTQGCLARGWSEGYLQHRRALAGEALADLGTAWDDDTTRDKLRAQSEQLDPSEVRDAIGDFAAQFEPRVRELTGTTASFNLTIENVELDAYWSYWLDGAGHDAAKLGRFRRRVCVNLAAILSRIVL